MNRENDLTYSGTILTPWRREVMEMDAKSNLIIVGPFGAGKTSVLCQRAWHLAGTTSRSPGKFKIFVSSEELQAEMHNKFRLPGMPLRTVTTLQRWCEERWDKFKIGRLPYKSCGVPDGEEILQRVLNHIRSKGSAFRRAMPFAMVDDGQFLDPVSLEIIERISQHVTVAVECPMDYTMDFPMDLPMAPNESGMTIEEMCGILDIGPDRVVDLPVFSEAASAQRRSGFSSGTGKDGIPPPPDDVMDE